MEEIDQLQLIILNKKKTIYHVYEHINTNDGLKGYLAALIMVLEEIKFIKEKGK